MGLSFSQGPRRSPSNPSGRRPPHSAPPPKRRETPCILPPRDSGAPPAAVFPDPSPAHVGASAEAPRHPLPRPDRGASHSARSLSPTPPAGSGLRGYLCAHPPSRTRRLLREVEAPRPATFIPHHHAGAALGPTPVARGGRTANRPLPFPQWAPRSPLRRGSGSCGLRPTQAWLRTRALTSRAVSWRLGRSRRGRTASGRPWVVPSAVAASSQPRPRRQLQRLPWAPALQRLLS